MSEAFSPALTAVVVVGGIWCVYKVTQLGKRRKGLPPGPPTIPVLGNVLQYPTKDAYHQ